jgi:3-hydroxyisobutyrate dehydrogenase
MSSPGRLKVGIIGIGAMGSAIIRRYAEIGIRPITFDISEDGRRRAAELDAEPCNSPSAVAAAADIVSVMVRTDEETLDAVLGPGGALAGMSAGKTLLLQSTIHPDTTRKIALAGEALGVIVADAPVVGIPPVIRAGHGVALVGTDPERFPAIEQNLRLVYRDVLHMGPLGSGNVAKIVKNLTTAAEALVIAEALRIAEAAGIPYLQALDMMTRVEQYHFIDHWQVAFDASGRSSDLLDLPNLYDKDVPLAGQISNDLQVDAPITRALVTAARRVCERTRPARLGS